MTVKPRLLDQVREKIRLKHYSIRTEQAYEEMGKQEVEPFLSRLAVERHVAASTQNQTRSALSHVLNRGGRGVVSPLDAF